MSRAKETADGAVCVLTSGGIESAALLSDALGRATRVIPVYVKSGLSWESAELPALKLFLKKLHSPRLRPLEILELPMKDVYGRHWSVTGRGVPGASSADQDVYLPGRNLVLLAKAACLAVSRGATAVEIGALGSNPFPDASPLFFARMAGTLSQALGTRIDVRAPLSKLHKPEVVRRFAALPLELTFSCIRPRGRKHCGACNKCVERKKAFFEAGVPDRTRYAVKGIAA